MVRTILSVILNHEDCRLSPELRLCNRVDHHPERKIVRSNTGRRRDPPRLKPIRMILTERHHHVVPPLASGFSLMQLFDEDLSELRVALPAARLALELQPLGTDVIL